MVVNNPREVGVVVDGSGEPDAVLHDGGRWRVARVQNRWRVDDEWWRGEISRMYYELLLSNGAVLTVFHDLVSDRWYRQRY